MELTQEYHDAVARRNEALQKVNQAKKELHEATVQVAMALGISHGTKVLYRGQEMLVYKTYFFDEPASLKVDLTCPKKDGTMPSKAINPCYYVYIEDLEVIHD